jgi:hypothetical protein
MSSIILIIYTKCPNSSSELELASEAQYKQDGDVSVTI